MRNELTIIEIIRTLVNFARDNPDVSLYKIKEREYENCGDYVYFDDEEIETDAGRRRMLTINMVYD